MANSVNKVILVGNLGRDPESRSFQNGGKVVNLRVATSESWKDKQSGEWRDKTEWHQVAIFNEALGRAAEKLRKGSKVYIEGQLQTRKWQDQSGNDRYSTEVVIQNFNGALVSLDRAEGGGGGQRSSGGWGEDDGGFGSGGDRFSGNDRGGGQRTQSRPTSAFDSDLDDDVPF